MEHAWSGEFGYTYRAWTDDPRFPKAERRHPKMLGPSAPKTEELIGEILALAEKEQVIGDMLAAAETELESASEQERKLREAVTPVLAAFQERASAWTRVREGHRYLDPDGTSDCLNGCGCYVGPFTSGGPDGVDPFGACPKASDAAPRTIHLTAEFDVEALRALLKEE